MSEARRTMPQRARRTEDKLETWIVNKTIRHWEGLSPAVKDVWTDLWTLAGGRPARVRASTAGLAGHTGLSDRQVRRALRMLQAMTAIKIFDWPSKGALDLYALDPDEIARARIVAPDPQGALFSEPMEEDDRRVILPNSQPGSPAPIGEALEEAIWAVTGPDHRAKRKMELINYITKAVADPEMHPAIAERAASAVTDYGLSIGLLESVVEATRRKRVAGEITGSPGKYFHYRVRKEIQTRGIPWFPESDQG